MQNKYLSDHWCLILWQKTDSFSFHPYKSTPQHCSVFLSIRLDRIKSLVTLFTLSNPKTSKWAPQVSKFPFWPVYSRFLCTKRNDMLLCAFRGAIPQDIKKARFFQRNGLSTIDRYLLSASASPRTDLSMRSSSSSWRRHLSRTFFCFAKHLKSKQEHKLKDFEFTANTSPGQIAFSLTRKSKNQTQSKTHISTQRT